MLERTVAFARNEKQPGERCEVGKRLRIINKKAGEETRTPDLLITNELLYQLSYTGLPIT